MKRFIPILLAMLCISNTPLRADNTPKAWMVGTEFDLIPYLFDGYYVSGIAGYGHWRARYVRTEITTPGFATPSGFDDNDLKVNAYIIDYYFKKGFEGWWVGPGFETWDGNVRREGTSLKQTYHTKILTLGGGYTFRFNDHFYLNPWAALHIPVGGDKEVAFPDKTFEIKPVPEGSIKVGVNF